MNKRNSNKKINNSNQQQLSFGMTYSDKEQSYNAYDCIERYKYVGLDNRREYLFEKDSSLNQCVISSTTGEEVEAMGLPLLSEISAGTPIYMNEDYEEHFYIPRDAIRWNKDLFMLKIKGDSMIDAGIDDGDYVVIKKDPYVGKKDIVAVEVDGHATLKRFEVKGNKLTLIPENANYERIIVNVEDARIIGSAIGVIKPD